MKAIKTINTMSTMQFSRNFTTNQHKPSRTTEVLSCGSCGSWLINLRKYLSLFGIFPIALLLFAACENPNQPFKAGLGPVVDTRPPSVTLKEPGAGDYIWGKKDFSGEADDDYQVDRVEIQVTNQPNKTYLKEWTNEGVDLKLISPGKYTWTYTLDTTEFDNGDFKIRLRVFDKKRKDPTTTDEIAFQIKNDRPVIKVAMPPVPEGSEDGNVGGANLNFFSPADSNYLPEVTLFAQARQVDQDASMAGTITDGKEVYTGNEPGRFPPQFRLWRISNPGEIVDPEREWPPNVVPEEDKVPWKNFVLNESLFALGVGSYQFIEKISEEAGRFYGFQIRAQSVDERTDFTYPVDYYPSDKRTAQNSYILIYVRIPRDSPVVELYKLEDIFSEDSWKNGEYSPLKDRDNYNPHPFVTDLIVSKNGPFTLRVKASHPEGISAAEVYWEKDDKSARGRFIWDAADKLPPGESNPKWEPADNVSVNNPYSYWGFRDPNSWDGDFYTVRNFIFTYHDDKTKDRVPEGNHYHKQVAGRSTIHQFISADDVLWQRTKGINVWPSASEFNHDLWEEIEELEDGTYTIEVYARSAYGTIMSKPETYSINLDRRPPEVEINAIDGAYSLYSSNDYDKTGEGAVVNGVIRPRLRIDEPRREDSGLRDASGPDAGYYNGPEQRYILVKNSDKTAMDALSNAKNWWPDIPNSSDVFNGITAAKHAPIINSAALFKTSKIYDDDTEEPDVLAVDNTGIGVYWLYVFVRDKAFNVGKLNTPLKITVAPDTDKPKIDFSNSTVKEEVKDPKNDNVHNGFRDENGNLRNKLAATEAIRLRIMDDDSLDLGVEDGAESKVKISFVGSKNEGVAITPQENNRITLDDDVVKEIFSPQSAERGAVKERSGTIEQGVLLDALIKYNKDDPENSGYYDYLFIPGESYTGLPDGMYRITITIADYPPAKLKMPADTEPAAVVTKEAVFWVVVDNQSPVIINTSDKSSGAYISASGDEFITGTVYDINGPITVLKDRFRVTQRENEVDGVGFTLINPDPLIDWEMTQTDPDTPTPGVPSGMWEGNFAARINMNGRSGDYTFEIGFADRFGQSSTLTIQYRADNEPPTVGISRLDTVFTRNEADVNIGASNAINKTRLTNGVIWFTLAPSDNFSIAGVRWWLLPASAAPPASNAGGYDTAGYHDVDLSSRPYTMYFDTNTTATPDGEYRLHAMALDAAGLYSNTVSREIYILQEEDKPYFGPITPRDNTVVGESGLFVKGTIFDDDGFGNDITDIWADSIKIHLSNNPISDINDPALVFTSVASANGLTRSARNLTLNINLQTVFSAALSPIAANNGVKYYIIEAQDAPVNKKLANGNDDTASRVPRRKAFSFMYDTVPPTITITSPAQGTTFGTNAHEDFVIKVTMADANLKKESNQYRIKYQIDGQGGEEPIYLTQNTHEMVITDQGLPTESVSFIIPAYDVATSILDFSNLSAGPHTITLIAEDESGNTTTAPLSFTKDTDSPTFTFNNISEFVLPNNIIGTQPRGIGNWWTSMPTANNTQRQEWFEAKRRWLAAQTQQLSVIYHDNGVPVLTGAFEDETSDIDTNSFKYRIDNDPTERGGNGNIEGSGRDVRWTVYLTDDGTNNGSALADGVHTIRLKVADTTGNELAYTDGADGKEAFYYAFRIDSRQPTAAITSVTPDVTHATDVVINGTVSDANLKSMTLSIVGPPPLNTPITIPNSGDLIAASPTPTPNATPGWLFDIGSSSPYANPPTLETFTWSYTLNNVSTLAEGTYNVYVRSVDADGRESALAVSSFIIDHFGPAVAFDDLLPLTADDLNPETLIHTGSAGVNVNVLRSEAQTVRGTAVELISALDTLQSRIEQWNWTNGGWSVVAGEDWKALNVSGNWVKQLRETGETMLSDGLYRMQVRAKDTAGNETTSNYMYFYYDRSASPFTLTSTLNSFYSIGVSRTLIFNGSVTNANRFRSVTASFPDSTVITDITVNPWTPASFNTGAGTQPWSVSVTINGNTPGDFDGRHKITFTATNMANITTEITVDLVLDSTAPFLDVTDPALRIPAVTNWADATETLNSHTDVYIVGESADRNPDDNTIGEPTGVQGLWYRIGTMSATGNNPRVRPTEDTIRTEVNNLLTANGNNFDTVAEAPGNLWFKMGGTAKPSAFVIESSNIHAWRIKIPTQNPTETDKESGLGQFWREISLKGSANYNTTANNRLTVDLTQEQAGSSGIVSLPLWIRAVDRAGNVSYLCREIWFNPNADAPSVEIKNPDDNKSLTDAMGGSIVVTGEAKNISSVYAVAYRVTVSKIDDSSPTVMTNDSWLALKDGVGMKIPDSSSTTPVGWYLVNAESAWGNPEVPWNFMVNGDNEINAQMSAWGEDTAKVFLEVYAFSGSSVVGTISARETRTFYIRESAPIIDTMRITSDKHSDPQDYGDPFYRIVRGTFTISARLDANDYRGIKEIAVRLEGEPSPANEEWVTVFATDGTAVTVLTGLTLSGSGNERTLTYTLDSTSTQVRNGGWKRTGGKYPIRIRIKDNAPMPGSREALFDMGIDNFAPVADTEPGSNTPKKVAGLAAEFQGRVFDYYGTPPATPADRGIKTIHAWFTTGTTGNNYIKLNSIIDKGETATDIETTPITPLTGKSRAVTVVYQGNDIANAATSISQPPDSDATTAVAIPTDAAYVKTINATTGAPGSGTGLSWTAMDNAAADIRWRITLDSTKMPTGWITLHYVVEDNLGNMSYYTQETVVMNNAPKIEAITLYTDNRGTGAPFTQVTGDVGSIRYAIGDYNQSLLANGYVNSGFIVKNNFITFKVETLQGNEELNYQVQYVQRELITLTYNSGSTAPGDNNLTAMTNGINTGINLYTIADRGDYSDYDWADIGVKINEPPAGTHFVYTQPPAYKNSSTAKVWKYTLVSTLTDTEQTDIGGSTDPSNEEGHNPFGFIGSSSFGASAIREINSSHPTAAQVPNTSYPYDDGVGNAAPTYVFLIRVWDKVNNDAGATINDQLHDAAVMHMNVIISDTGRPEVKLYDLNPYTITTSNYMAPNAPNGQTNDRRGGLYNASTESSKLLRSGHIEPRTNSQAKMTNGTVIAPNYTGSGTTYATNIPRDMVSGTVILRGQAWDDQLIENVKLTIGNGTAITLFTFSETGVISISDPDNVAIEETMDWRTGHTVEWAYRWDTEGYNTGIPTTPVSIKLEIKDRKNATTGTNDNIGSAYYSSDGTAGVDIVPFIYGFKRQDKYDTTRSRQGWYSFYQGEQNITVLGYNLNGTGRQITLTSGTGAGNVSTFAVNGATTTGNPAFNIPAAAVSSAISLTTSGVETVNHKVDHSRDWNKEYYNRTSGSDLWVSKPYAHIWRSTQSNAVPVTYFGNLPGTGSSTAAFRPATPSMKLVYTGGDAGRLIGAWGSFNDTATFWSFNNGAERNTIRRSHSEPYVGVDIGYYNGDNGANSANIAAVLEGDGDPHVLLYTGNTSIPTNQGPLDSITPSGANFGLMARQYNTRNMLVGYTGAVGGTWPDHGIHVTPSNGAEDRSDYSIPTDSLQNVRVARSAANDHVVVYNKYEKSLIYSQGRNNKKKYGNTGGAPQIAFDNNEWATNVYIDGPATNVTVTNSNVGGAGAIEESKNAGEYSAVDYDSSGNPIVAYFDEEKNTLRLAYATSMEAVLQIQNVTVDSVGNFYHDTFVLSVGDPVIVTEPASASSAVSAHIVRDITNAGNFTTTALTSYQSNQANANQTFGGQNRRYYRFTQGNYDALAPAAGDVVWVSANNNIANATARYVLWVGGGGDNATNRIIVSNNFVYTGVATTDTNNVFDPGNTNNYYFWKVPRNDEVTADTRYFTSANHGLGVGAQVRIGNATTGTQRRVVWADANNFKLSVNADGTGGAWDTNDPTITVYTTRRFRLTESLQFVAPGGQGSAESGIINESWTPTAGAGYTVAKPQKVTSWTRRYVLPTDHALRNGSGRFVSIKVGANNRIHLAFFNNRLNTVVYAEGTIGGTFTAYTVDNVVAGGTRTSISLDSANNPYIVYGVSSRTGNYDGARMAYRSTGTNVPFAGSRWTDPHQTGVTVEGWEAVSMPSDYKVINDRLNVEAWPPVNRSLGAAPATTNPIGGWNAAVGYASDHFRIAYFYTPTYKGY